MGTQFRFEWRISEFLLTLVSSDNTDMRWVPVARILQSTSEDTQKSEHWLRRGFISGTGGPVVPEKVQSDACGIADCNAFLQQYSIIVLGKRAQRHHGTAKRVRLCARSGMPILTGNWHFPPAASRAHHCPHLPLPRPSRRLPPRPLRVLPR